MKTTYKVSHATGGHGVPVLRKLTLETTSISTLRTTIVDRFQFSPDTPLGLYYRDEEDDLITLSSDQDLQELLASPDAQNGTVRIEVRTGFAVQAAPFTSANPVTATLPTYSSDSAIRQQARDVTEDWTEIDNISVEDEPLLAGFSQQVYGQKDDTDKMDTSADEGNETAAALAEDPAEPVLPGTFTTRLEAMIDAEFPREQEKEATPTLAGSEPADPADEPLDDATATATATGANSSSAAPEPMAFSSLPASLSAILSGLPSHAGAFSAQLAALAGSPDSALGRLSALVSNPTGAVQSGAINLSDLSSSLSGIGVEMSAAVQEVLQSVRSEADGVRSEFERFKTEVEAEKARFEQEIRAALDEAKRARTEAQAASTPAPAPAPAPEKATQADETPDADVKHDRDAPSRYATRPAQGRGWGGRHHSKRYSGGANVTTEWPCGPGSTFGRRCSGWTPNSSSSWGQATSAAWNLPGAWNAAAPAQAAAWGAAAPAQAGASSMSDIPHSMPGSLPHWGASRATPAQTDNTFKEGVGAPVQANSSATTEGADDAGKPVLLTTFIGAARQIGFDVDDSAIRIALTDIWCDCNGRGMSGMLDEACEKLFA